MKNLIASGMTLPQGALSIAQALADMGGTDKDFTSLIGNKQLCGEIAKIILDRHFVTLGRPILGVYPDWVKGYVTSEDAHPYSSTEFDVRTLEQWLSPTQKEGHLVAGLLIHRSLMDHNLIKMCLGVFELVAIKKKGPAFFKEHFNGLIVMGWRSVVEHHKGTLCVPGLSLDNWGMEIVWYRLDEEFGSNHPALLFKEK